MQRKQEASKKFATLRGAGGFDAEVEDCGVE
jgi:hypothetical protein